MSSLVLEAAQADLPPCPNCRALRRDPCRAPSNKVCPPHAARLRLVRQDNLKPKKPKATPGSSL